MMPMICPLGKTTDEMLGYGERILLKAGLVKNGETTLVTAGGTANKKASNMLKIHVISSSPTADVAARDARVVLVTAPRGAKAERLARRARREAHAACVNVVPGVVSHYRWEGRLRRDAESLLIAKTRAARLPALKRWLAANHPYSTPELLALRVADGAASYLAWLARETK